MHRHLSPSRAVAGLAVAVTAVALLAVSGCSSSSPADASGSDSSGPSAPASSGTGALSIADPWIKAADSGMTAAFGTLVNASDHDVRIVSASTDVSAAELHEKVADDSGQALMRPKEGGFLVPAGGEYELSPGGDHVMLMDLTGPVEPGDDVEVTLSADDGSTFAFIAPARSYSGANESYDGNGDGMGDMDMPGSAS